jgi:hypothetical protein
MNQQMKTIHDEAFSLDISGEAHGRIDGRYAILRRIKGLKTWLFFQRMIPEQSERFFSKPAFKVLS